MDFSKFEKFSKVFLLTRGEEKIVKIGHEMLFDINLSHSLQNLHAQPHPRAMKNTRREKSVEKLLNHEHFTLIIINHVLSHKILRVVLYVTFYNSKSTQLLNFNEVYDPDPTV